MKDGKLTKSEAKNIAESLFIKEGFSIDEIQERLGDSPSRKTLYNWKNSEKWESKREKLFKINLIYDLEIQQLYEKALKDSILSPTLENLHILQLAQKIFFEHEQYSENILLALLDEFEKYKGKTPTQTNKEPLIERTKNKAIIPGSEKELKYKMVLALKKKGYAYRKIAKEVGLSRSTIMRIIKKAASHPTVN